MAGCKYLLPIYLCLPIKEHLLGLFFFQALSKILGITLSMNEGLVPAIEELTVKRQGQMGDMSVVQQEVFPEARTTVEHPQRLEQVCTVSNWIPLYTHGDNTIFCGDVLSSFFHSFCIIGLPCPFEILSSLCSVYLTHSSKPRLDYISS